MAKLLKAIWLDRQGTKITLDGIGNNGQKMDLGEGIRIMSADLDRVDEPKLSDLEIVQKALLKTDQYVDLMGDGRWYVCDKYTRSTGPSGEDNQSLLAWAKQTVGGE